MQNKAPKLILTHSLPPNDTHTNELGLTKSAAQRLNKLKVPNLRKILEQSIPSFKKTLAPTSLNTPAEIAVALAMGWTKPDGIDELDGELPFAALKAAELGLIQPAKFDAGSWAFITLCSWSVQHGQVSFSADANELGLEASESEKLFQKMKPYFAEDSIQLFADMQLQPGQWLAYSEHFSSLASASLGRVSGRIIDDFLIGTGKSENHKSANLLRRLQNEMQMLLYQDSVNDHRSIPINSFWISGTGTLTFDGHSLQTMLEAYKHIQIKDVYTTQTALLHPDDPEWLNAWSRDWELIDATLLDQYLVTKANKINPTQLSLCNETTCITLSPVERSWSRNLIRLFKSNQLSNLLGF